MDKNSKNTKNYPVFLCKVYLAYSLIHAKAQLTKDIPTTGGVMTIFDEFKMICRKLNQVGIIPTLMGSLGLEYVSKVFWNPSDIDIHVPGDPRGWDAPDELRIYDWDKILVVMNDLGYDLVDLHEHAFQKNEMSVEYGTIDSLYEFAGISPKELKLVELDEVTFYVPSLRQFLSIYEASSKDSYRNDQNNHKDFAKIEWLKKTIK